MSDIACCEYIPTERCNLVGSERAAAAVDGIPARQKESAAVELRKCGEGGRELWGERGRPREMVSVTLEI